jgi:hypothetical protein
MRSQLRVAPDSIDPPIDRTPFVERKSLDLKPSEWGS